MTLPSMLHYESRRIVFLMLAVTILLCIAVVVGYAQDSAYLPITVRDDLGHHMVLTLGYHTKAGTAFNWSLGERPIPPVPMAPVFDARFSDVTHRRSDYPGLDSYMDVRPFGNAGRADTFFVRVQPADESFPVSLTWDRSLARPFGGLMLMYREQASIKSLDMLRSDSLRVGSKDDPVGTFVIVAANPRTPAHAGRKARSRTENNP